jgi:anti-anti-sigma factor
MVSVSASTQGENMTAQTLARSADSLLPVIELLVVDSLDISTLMQFSEQLDDAITLRPERVVVDLSRCDYIDAQAIRVLMDTHRSLWLQGGRLTLRGVGASTMRLLALAGVRDVFTFEALVVQPSLAS